MDLGVYCVNTTRWLVDEDPTEVSAQSLGARHRYGSGMWKKASRFRLRFPSGLMRTGQFVLRGGFVVPYICSGDEGLGFVDARVSIRRRAAADGKDREAID